MSGMKFRVIVNSVPKGGTFTILSDSCHSGGLIDKDMSILANSIDLKMRMRRASALTLPLPTG